jgi:hypothetical protein
MNEVTREYANELRQHVVVGRIRLLHREGGVD